MPFGHELMPSAIYCLSGASASKQAPCSSLTVNLNENSDARLQLVEHCGDEHESSLHVAVGTVLDMTCLPMQAFEERVHRTTNQQTRSVSARGWRRLSLAFRTSYSAALNPGSRDSASLGVASSGRSSSRITM